MMTTLGPGRVKRFSSTGMATTFFVPAPPGAFPQTPPAFGEAITWGVDDTLKTPYAYTVDFSIGRELPKRFSLQLSYVGRFGRDLLTQRDLTQPLTAAPQIKPTSTRCRSARQHNPGRRFT